MTQAPTVFDLHEALASELLAAEECALAIEHAYTQANPLTDKALDAVFSVTIHRLKEVIEKAFEIETRMRQAAK